MNKLEKFEENKSFHNLFQPTFDELKLGYKLKGKWNTFFKNDNPITLELGCGKGEYTVGLGKKYPNRNFIGIDKKGARIWRGCKTSTENEIANIAFIRTKMEQLEFLFDTEEVAEIWITFPEPQPKNANTKKRFTSPQFNSRFANILKPEGIIHLKTDDTMFYEYTLDVIRNDKHNLLKSTADLYKEYPDWEVASIQTFYEQMWLEQGLKIKYLEYKLNAECFKKRDIVTKFHKKIY